MIYVVFLDVKQQFHIQKNYRYWMMMTGFDSCIRQHPMWPSYEELIDHLPSMKNWTQWQKLSRYHDFVMESIIIHFESMDTSKSKGERPNRNHRNQAFNERSLQDSRYMWPHFPMVPCFSNLQVSFQVI
jgi:hypothetical protein